MIQEKDPDDGNCGTADLEGETTKAVEGKGGLNKQVCLTGGYINALSHHQDTSSFNCPILQVVERETKFKDPEFDANTFKNGKNKNTQIPQQHTLSWYYCHHIT